MIINPDHEVFEDIYYKLFEMTPKSNPKRHMCNISSSILAYHLVPFSKTGVYIIDSKNHSVVFDGKSTWDLNLGIVFENYKYPKSPLSKYIKIPKFYFNFSNKLFNKVYSNEGLFIAKNNPTVKLLTSL